MREVRPLFIEAPNGILSMSSPYTRGTKLRLGSFVPAVLKLLPCREPARDKRQCCRTVAEGHAVRSAAFLVSMTGDAVSQGDIARLFDVYLQKPFSCEALMQVIEDARCSSDAVTLQAA